MTSMPDLPAEVILALSTAHPGVTVSTDLTGYVNGDPWIEVVESPGREVVRNRLHAPIFDFNVYEATIEATRSLAMDALSTVTGLVGRKTSELVITYVDVTVLPFKFTDLVNNRPRYIFTAAIYYRPN